MTTSTTRDLAFYEMKRWKRTGLWIFTISLPDVMVESKHPAIDKATAARDARQWAKRHGYEFKRMDKATPSELASGIRCGPQRS